NCTIFCDEGRGEPAACVQRRRKTMSAQFQYRRVTDPKTEDERVALNKEAFKHDLLDNLFCIQGKNPALATRHDYYLALAYTVRDRMLHRWISTAETYTTHGSRTVAYLSAEF